MQAIVQIGSGVIGVGFAIGGDNFIPVLECLYGVERGVVGVDVDDAIAPNQLL